MGQTVNLQPPGASGYLSLPSQGSGPAVLVVQEWWGLDDWIKSVVDRLATEGFVALAPDLYRGQLAGHTEIERAGELMREMPVERAAEDMGGAMDYLAGHERTSSDSVGVLGFCMGGMMAFELACQRPEAIGAVISFYGFPVNDPPPDYTRIAAAIQFHVAELDTHFTPAKGNNLHKKLLALGKQVSIRVHDGAGHAFMAEHNTMGTYDPELAAEIWPTAMSFIREHLAGSTP